MPAVALYTYSTEPRGSVVHTAFLAEALHAAGWSVTVNALSREGRPFFRALRGPQLRLIPAAPTPPTTADVVRVRRAELAAHLLNDVDQHQLHHAEDCLTASGLLDARAAGRPLTIVRTVHHVERFDDPYLAACQERSILHADRVLTVSAAAAEDIQRSFDVEAGLVGNGVDCARFVNVDPRRVDAWRARLGAEGAPVVLAAGGIEERKNTLRTLRAFASLRATYRGARLWIMGGASVLQHDAYRATFDEELAALPTATRAAVTGLGVVADQELPALLQAADVLAMPSLHEGFGLVALEALAAGLPVVAAQRPPFTEFLDTSCALLVDPLSEAAITSGLLQALDEGPRRREAGRRRARRHGWDQVAQRHIAHYQRLLGTGAAQRREVIHARDALRGPLA